MAERMEGETPKGGHDYEEEFEQLEKMFRGYCTEASNQSIATEMKTVLAPLPHF